MEWLSTGIEDLDKYINGFPVGRTTFVAGTPGAGKTILALHFANKCLDDGKRVCYISTEERPGDIIGQAESMGMSGIKKAHESGQLAIMPLFEERAEEMKSFYLTEYHRVARDFLLFLRQIPDNMDVVIIDNLGALSIGLSPEQFRDQFDILNYLLSQRGYTSLIISDVSVDERMSLVAMHSAYAAIRMVKRENPYTGKIERVMDIVKVRSSATPAEYLLYDITNQGIKILGKSRT